MNEPTNYGEMLKDLGKVIQYIKENPEEFTRFCASCCLYRYTCVLKVKRFKHNKLIEVNKLDRSKCPIYSSKNPIQDFDKRIKTVIIMGEI